jgi:hypothetical protein
MEGADLMDLGGFFGGFGWVLVFLGVGVIFKRFPLARIFNPCRFIFYHCLFNRAQITNSRERLPLANWLKALFFNFARMGMIFIAAGRWGFLKVPSNNFRSPQSFQKHFPRQN